MAVPEPREPAAEAAALSVGQAVGDVELQVHRADEAGETGMAGEEIVDDVRGFLEFPAGDENARAGEHGDGLGFGADVGFADDLPLLEGAADVVGVEATGSVVHGEQQDRQAGRRAHVGDGAGLDLPGSVLPDEFRAGVGAEQERCG